MPLKHNAHVIIFIVAALIAFGCVRDPGFPIEPVIKFNSIRFIPNSTIKVAIDFTDGDGDLGLNPTTDTFPPYNRVLERRFLNDSVFYLENTNPNTANIFIKFFLLNTQGEFVTCENDPQCSTRFLQEPVDAFVIRTATQVQIRVTTVGGIVVRDTLRNNVQNVVRKPGITRVRTFAEILDNDWNRTFPPLFDKKPGSPLSGTIFYDLNTASWLNIFNNRVIKLRLFIKDRALNTSNTIETDTLRIR